MKSLIIAVLLYNVLGAVSVLYYKTHERVSEHTIDRALY